MISIDSILQNHTAGRNLAPWKVTLMKPFLKTLLHEKTFIEFDKQFPHLDGIAMIEQIFTYFQIKCETDISELENIPARGAVVIVANHPIGSIDGLALLKTVAHIRPDVKIVANQILSYLKPLKDLFIAVDNMSGKGSSRKQIELIQEHLKQGGVLILFPSGEVSRFGLKGVRDKKWNRGFLRLADKAKAPIVPVHIDGRNSAFFYITSLISKPLSTLFLVREMFKQRGKSLKIRIGKCIPHSVLKDKYESPDELSRQFHRHIYMLGKGKAGCIKGDAPIALPQSKAVLKSAVESCEKLGTMQDGSEIYLYKYKDVGHSAILHELGRLREISFRAVGEGSGQRLDLDTYDKYYYHLILWDPKRIEIIGAYRFVPSKEARLENLYSHSLFHYSEEMKPILEQGIELGRSFIQPNYWGRRGLDYLWQGIGSYLAKYPQYRYLFGPVSISGALPVDAKELLVSFYKLHFSSKKQMAVSKRPYMLSSQEISKKFDGIDYKKDFTYLKSMLTNMGCGVPTLYKQYSELCEPGGVEFMDFGVDPGFNNCIDGLVVVDMSKLKPSRYQRYIAPFLDSYHPEHSLTEPYNSQTPVYLN
ncbi:MAG: lysophospholipid acyltransferase family protein [Endomicrobia bacterium]|nr:lysophospholipid acyltransferase family protein [Endomicrobiia bacterium]MCL2506151.1 lysophospholipid acyltransferase family protein [Endomicrobiia bacterium]